MSLEEEKFFENWSEKSIDERNRFIEKNIFLVRGAVRRLCAHPEDRDDAIQYGILGLIKAVEGYDPARGVTFSAYADRFIHGKILDGLRVHKNIKIKGQRVSYKYINEITENFRLKHGVDPSIQNITDEIFTIKNWKDDERLKERIREAVDTIRYRTVSIDCFESEIKDTSTHNNLDECVISEEKRAILHDCIAKLSVNEKLVVRKYFWDESIQKDIAKILCVTRPMVSKILLKAREKLKRCIDRKYMEEKHD